MVNKVIQHAEQFVNLGIRLKEMICLVPEHHGKIVRAIGLTYGSNGLTYAIQLRFESKQNREQFTKKAQMIEGFIADPANEPIYLALLQVFLLPDDLK